MIRPDFLGVAAFVACAATCTLVPGVAARAEVLPVAVPQGDRRVTTTPFDEDEIVRVPVGKHGVQVVFSRDETTFEVDLGDPSQPGYAEVSSGWLWDRSQHTVYFRPWPGKAVDPRIVRVVSPLPGGGTRRYQLELIPVDAGGASPTLWQRPRGAMEVRASADGAGASVSDVLPDGPLPGGGRDASGSAATPAPVEIVPAVVRFTYAREEAAAKVEAARKRREDAVREWRLRNPAATPQARADQAEQARLRAEVISSAQAAVARKRCNVMWRGDGRLAPRAICNTGLFTTFAYTGMTVPALFAVGPDGKDTKVQHEAVPGQPGLIMVRATAEFWRARAGGVQVAEFYDASYDPTGGVVTGTDTASPYVRMTVADPAARTAGAAAPGRRRAFP